MSRLTEPFRFRIIEFTSVIAKIIYFSLLWPNEFFSLRRKSSLFARYSLKFTRCSFLVVKSIVDRSKICLLLVAEVALCKKSLITCCRSCSLQKNTRYSSQNLLVTHCRSFSLQKFTRYSLQSSLVTRCRSCSLEKITRYTQIPIGWGEKDE